MDINVQELKQKLDRGDDFLLLDVRTPTERDIAAIPQAVLLPLQELDAGHPTLEGWKDREVVCMCHHGGRSARAQQYLLSSGFTNVKNLEGGIHAWSEEIDPSVPQYD
jgi:rhodanese-related sulfurtransferase